MEDLIIDYINEGGCETQKQNKLGRANSPDKVVTESKSQVLNILDFVRIETLSDGTKYYTSDLDYIDFEKKINDCWWEISRIGFYEYPDSNCVENGEYSFTIINDSGDRFSMSGISKWESLADIWTKKVKIWNGIIPSSVRVNGNTLFLLFVNYQDRKLSKASFDNISSWIMERILKMKSTLSKNSINSEMQDFMKELYWVGEALKKNDLKKLKILLRKEVIINQWIFYFKWEQLVWNDDEWIENPPDEKIKDKLQKYFWDIVVYKILQLNEVAENWESIQVNIVLLVRQLLDEIRNNEGYFMRDKVLSDQLLKNYYDLWELCCNMYKSPLDKQEKVFELLKILSEGIWNLWIEIDHDMLENEKLKIEIIRDISDIIWECTINLKKLPYTDDFDINFRKIFLSWKEKLTKFIHKNKKFVIDHSDGVSVLGDVISEHIADFQSNLNNQIELLFWERWKEHEDLINYYSEEISALYWELVERKGESLHIVGEKINTNIEFTTPEETIRLIIPILKKRSEKKQNNDPSYKDLAPVITWIRIWNSKLSEIGCNGQFTSLSFSESFLDDLSEFKSINTDPYKIIEDKLSNTLNSFVSDSDLQRKNIDGSSSNLYISWTKKIKTDFVWSWKERYEWMSLKYFDTGWALELCFNVLKDKNIQDDDKHWKSLEVAILLRHNWNKYSNLLISDEGVNRAVWN